MATVAMTPRQPATRQSVSARSHRSRHGASRGAASSASMWSDRSSMGGGSASARLPVMPKGSIASSSGALRWLDKVTPETTKVIKFNYMDKQTHVNHLLAKVQFKTSKLRALQDTYDDITNEIEGKLREQRPADVKITQLKTQLAGLDAKLDALMQKRTRMDCLLLRTQNEWVDALGKLEDISSYRGKQLKAMVLGAGFKQHSEMLRDALQGKATIVRNDVRDKVLGHRKRLEFPKKELTQLKTLQSALESAGAVKLDPGAEARVAELKKRAHGVEQRKTLIQCGIDYHSRGNDCLQLLKDKGHELPDLDVLLERLLNNTHTANKLTETTRSLLQNKDNLKADIAGLVEQRELARFCMADVDTNEQAEALAVEEVGETVKTAKAEKQVKKKQLIRLAETEQAMVLWVATICRLTGVVAPPNPITPTARARATVDDTDHTAAPTALQSCADRLVLMCSQIEQAHLAWTGERFDWVAFFARGPRAVGMGARPTASLPANARVLTEEGLRLEAARPPADWKPPKPKIDDLFAGTTSKKSRLQRHKSGTFKPSTPNTGARRGGPNGRPSSADSNTSSAVSWAPPLAPGERYPFQPDDVRSFRLELAPPPGSPRHKRNEKR